jgi:hypothetical protein
MKRDARHAPSQSSILFQSDRKSLALRSFERKETRMSPANLLIGGVALFFSIACFILFWKDATHKKPDSNALASRMRSLAPNLDTAALGDLAKALADAFSKVGPGLAALLGSILFLLLSGEAFGVYHHTGGTAQEQTTPKHADAKGTAASKGAPANPTGDNTAAATTNKS